MRVLMVFFVLVLSVEGNAQKRYTTAKGTVQFVSEAPLETITAATNELQGVLDASNGSFAFRVDVKTFLGFNSPLQREHFNENYLESAKYQYAVYSGKVIDEIKYGYTGKQEVRVKGIMSIHGSDHEEIITCDLNVDGNTIKVESRFPVLLQNYNITIPKVVNRKISEEISVVVKALLVLK